MKLTNLEKYNFINYVRELLYTEEVLTMRNYIQHGNTSTFTHCLVVAYYSYLLALRLPGAYDTKSIVRGAMLHDFYLYDWHIPAQSHRLHGFVHPGIALKNARKFFQLNNIEEDIIVKHMWPLTLNRLPFYKESLLVLLVDKYVSLAETLYIPVIPKDYRQLIKALRTSKPAF